MTAAFSVADLRFGLLRAINYTPETEAIRQRAAKSHKSSRSVPLGSLLASIGPGYGAVFTRLDCDRSMGVELVSQGDMFAGEPSGRVIRRDSMKNPERHEIKKWQILIAGAGTLGETELYGRSLVADDRLVGKYVGPHAMVLSFETPGSDLSLYAYAFLTSDVGIRAIRSASYGTKILALRKDLLRELPIPLADEETTKAVAAEIRAAVSARERYFTEIRLARALFESTPAIRSAQEMVSERKARCLEWSADLPSLGAWNFAAAGQALGFLRKQYRDRLKDATRDDGVFNGPRFARVPCGEGNGIDFLSQRDVFLIRPMARRIRHPGVSDELLFVDQNALLLGSHGQLEEGNIFGRVELAACGAHHAAITQDILRILPREGWRDILYAYLSTPLGLALLRSTAVGTSIPSMRIDLLLDLPIPEVSDEFRKQVSKHIAAAVLARREAARAEAAAVHRISTEVLPQWLA